MNTKVIDSKIVRQTKTSKANFPKVKMDGFYEAIEKTNMLEIVEAIKKERITKP